MKAGLFAGTLIKGAEELGIELRQNEIKKIEEFYNIMVKANKNLNLTAVVEEREAAVRHFLDSLTCLKAERFMEGRRLMDVGTGAGLPGIPLKICRSEKEIILVESQEKKVRFLREVIARLELKNIEAVCARAEDLGRKTSYRESSDGVVARAVAALEVAAEYCLPLIRTGGCFLAMKGPRAGEEIAASERAIEVLGGKIVEKINLRLPLTGDERNLLLIEKVRPTPENYPRRAGVPQKRPIK